jgi:hypothetical protein
MSLLSGAGSESVRVGSSRPQVSSMRITACRLATLLECRLVGGRCLKPTTKRMAVLQA